MLSERQEIILNSLIREYLESAEPVSSDLLSRSLQSDRGPTIESGKKQVNLGVSPATIRNELQELTELGYVTQPHTSAGRVPTEQGYKYFVEITFSQGAAKPGIELYLEKEIEIAKSKIEKELELAQRLTKSLTQMSSTLSYTKIEDKDTVFEMLKIIGPSQASHDKNISLIEELLKELGSF